MEVGAFGLNLRRVGWGLLLTDDRHLPRLVSVLCSTFRLLAPRLLKG